LSDYFVTVSRAGSHSEWQWEIHRRSKPLGIRLCGNSCKTEFAAKLAGEKALKELKDGIAREESGR